MALSIIGAGFGRTGTASLKLALERLGFGPCHHMSEVIQDPPKVDVWLRIGAGEALWDEAFAGYRATVDWPACTHWRALAAHYPEAKVILSLRDSGRWFESVDATILNAERNESFRGTPFGDMLERNIWRLFDGRLGDRAHMTAAFDRHNEAVREGVAPERLLVFDAKEGWGPLCAFLGVKAPDEPFPHVNTMEETRKLLEAMTAKRKMGEDVAGEIEGIYKSKGS